MNRIGNPTELVKRGVAVAMLGAALLFGSADAGAGEPLTIAVGEVSQPPENAGVDIAGIRAEAEGEIRQIDPSQAGQRHFVVSVALVRAVIDGPYRCKVAAMVRDAKTGAMIAIIEGLAHAEGPASAELRRQVAHAAVRSAMRRIPSALGWK